MTRALRAGAWSALDIGLRQGVTFLVSIILARLLEPSDFGVIALLGFFSGLSIIFVQGGLSEALIQYQATTPDQESAVFWWNLAASLIFGSLLVAIGPWLARVYAQPVLAPLMWVAAGQTACAAFGAVQTALLTRDLRMAAIAKAGVTSSVLSGALAILLAARGAGVWALGAQLVTAAAVNTALLWFGSSWRPIRHFNPRTIVHLLRFGGWLSVSSGLEVLYSQGFALLLGKFYGVRELGFFNRAVSTQQLPANSFSGIIGRVAFPLFAERKDDPVELRRGLRSALRIAMLINVPLMAGVALLPDLLLDVLFGRRWLPAAPILAILAGSGMLFPMQLLNLQLLLARGGSRTFFRLEVTKKLIGVALVAVGSLFGLLGLAWAMLALAGFALLINVEPVRRALGYGVIAQLRDLSDVIVATAAMAVVVALFRPLLSMPALPQLLLLAGVGGVIYFGIGLLLRLPTFTEAFAMAASLVRRRGEVAAPGA